MTDLIDVVQEQDPGSELVTLYELILKDNTILYFHPGYDSDDPDGYIYFRDRTSPYTVRTYTPLPLEISGVEYSADGSQNRPTLTVANVTATFDDEIGLYSNEDLIGCPITKRTTLKKYLYGQPSDSSPPIEFPIQKYIIDRISGENNVVLTFELASPFDLSGISIPNRSILGKYCSWQYQGDELYSRGGCIWNKDSLIELGTSSSTTANFKAYFTEKDEPIVTADLFSTDSSINGSFNANSYSYSVGDTIYISNGGGAVWMCRAAHTSTTWSQQYYEAYWDLVTHLTWLTSTAYYVNDYVKNGSSYYRCKVQHTSSSNFSDDSSKWDNVYIYTSFVGGTTYSPGDYVESTNNGVTTVWRALKSSSSTNKPTENVYWTRADKCGKKLSSCKCRFQYEPRNGYTNKYATPKTSQNSSKPLPFGSFPGAMKFR